MATGDRHTFRLGRGYDNWPVRGPSSEVVFEEHNNPNGSWLHLNCVDGTGEAQHGLRSMTMEDAEQLCFLLYDITQPLRDAREKALKEGA